MLMRHLPARLILAAAMLSLNHIAAAAKTQERVDATQNAVHENAGRRRQLPVDPIMLTPVVWSPVTTPVYPVTGTDGRIHLAYELLLTNISPVPVRLTSLEVVDPTRHNQVVGASRIITVKEADITNKFRPFGLPENPLDEASFTDRLQPGRSAILFLDVTVASLRDVPAVLKHRATLSLADAQGNTVTVTGIGGLTEVSRRPPIVLSPPLKGDGWVNESGCCEIISLHRSATLPANGTLRVPERFAIDFIRIDAQGRAVVGDPQDLANWHFYGAEIIAAAGGKVVEVVNNLPDQVPGEVPANLPPTDAGGNYVIIDIGGGRYAFYAHMIPGSVAVSVGDVVQTGQLLGHLGNSGNSTTPHLHFQVMDRPSPLDADSLPFVFDRMTLQGRTVLNLFELEPVYSSGGAIEIDYSVTGRRRMQMPLSKDILSFR